MPLLLDILRDENEPDSGKIGAIGTAGIIGLLLFNCCINRSTLCLSLLYASYNRWETSISFRCQHTC